jgi:sugar transferase (PEP-CTERM/EpsH1 system associated)
LSGGSRSRLFQCLASAQSTFLDAWQVLQRFQGLVLTRMASTKTKRANDFLERPVSQSLSRGGAAKSRAADSQLPEDVVEETLKKTMISRAGWTSNQSIAPQLTKPLRLLHIINSLGLGGTERGVLKIMEGLDPSLFDQRICAIRGAASELAEHPTISGRLSMAAEPGNSGFQFLTFRLASIFRKYRPHIVHSRNWGGIEAVAAGRLAGVPIVVHSEHGYELDMMSGLPLRRRLMRRGLYAMCDALFTVSRELKDYHCRQGWVSAQRIHVIPNGVNTNLFAPNSELRHRLREQFRFRPDSVVLGTVGRLVPIKAHGTLLRAAERLLELGMDVQVLLVGGGPELDRLRDYTFRSPMLKDHVTFVGSSLIVHELYQAMDVFVLPSIREGMSNTLLEAMASGLPCVATDVGSNGELVADGRWGFLFTPEDVAGLAQRLEQLVRQAELRATFAGAARQCSVAFYSLDRMISAYTDLYCGLARNRNLIARD